MTAGTPAAEVAVDEALVRRLLASQHPDLAELPLTPVDGGWDNALFRLGDDLAVRLPRRAVAVPLVEHEQRWLSALAPRLPLPVPAPVRTGRAGDGFPWPWSVVPWFEGETAEHHPPDTAEAPVLGTFLAALHQPAPPDAPANPWRGVPLEDRAPDVAARLERVSATGTDVGAAAEAWAEGLGAVPSTRAVWLHGDLHPRNVLVAGGRLSAVVDWGDLTSGDPAGDLAAMWMLFPPEAHDTFRAAYGDDHPDLWVRSRAWAAFFAVMLLDAGLVDDPGFVAVARATIDRLAASR